MDGSLEMDGPLDWSVYDDNDDGSKAQRTLKRGDACLACRKRRIRCNAEKPACVTCVRLKKTCVYETVQAPSRIAKLKDRIAELEGQMAAMLQTASTATTAAAPPIAPKDATVTPPAPSTVPLMNGYDPDFSFMYPPTEPAVPIVPAPIQSVGMGADEPAKTPASNTNGGSTDPSHYLHADHLHIPNVHTTPSPTPVAQLYDAQSSNPRPLQAPDPNFDFDFGLLDSSMMDLGSAFDLSASLFQSSPHDMFSFPAVTPSPRSAGSYDQLRDINARPQQGAQSSESIPHLATNGQSQHVSDFNVPDFLNAASGAMISSGLGGYVDAAPKPQNALSGGWFEADDVPSMVRDHLLDLYFANSSVFHSAFNIPRFYARLTLPPAKRPHPALVYMMYLYGCQSSPQQSLRNLESRFYEIAQAKIAQGIREADRPLDIVRALTLMSSYLFAKEWYNLGYNFVGQAVRLAITCALHKIPSGVWTPHVDITVPILHTLRAGNATLKPPEDAVELAERIHIFWYVYELDQCTFVTYQWSPMLRIQDVITPLPRPMQDYGQGLVSRLDDVRVSCVFGSAPYGWDPKRHGHFASLRMRALTLLAAAVTLRLTPVAPEHEAMHHQPPGFFLGYRSIADINPQAHANLRHALDRFRSELPPGNALPWRSWDEGEYTPLRPLTRSTQSASINFIVAASYMHLWDVRSMSFPNKRALLVARRLTLLVDVHVNDSIPSEAENMVAGYGAFFLSIWDSAAKIIIREIKRLEGSNDMDAAKILRADLSTLDSNIAHWGKVMTQHQGDTMSIASVYVKLHNYLLGIPHDVWRDSQMQADKRYL